MAKGRAQQIGIDQLLQDIPTSTSLIAGVVLGEERKETDLQILLPWSCPHHTWVFLPLAGVSSDDEDSRRKKEKG